MNLIKDGRPTKLVTVSYFIYFLLLFTVDSLSATYVMLAIALTILMLHIQFFALPLHLPWSARQNVMYQSKLARTNLYGYLIHPWPIIAYYVLTVSIGFFNIWAAAVAFVIPIIRSTQYNRKKFREALSCGLTIVAAFYEAVKNNEKTDTRIINQLKRFGYNVWDCSERDITQFGTDVPLSDEKLTDLLAWYFIWLNIGCSAYLDTSYGAKFGIEYNKLFINQLKSTVAQYYSIMDLAKEHYGEAK